MNTFDISRRCKLGFVALAIAAVTAAGCADTPEGERADRAVDSVFTVPSRAYPPERLAIAVRQSQVSATIVFRPGAATLTPEDRANLTAFVVGSGAGPGDSATVTVSADGPRALAARRAAAIASALHRHRLVVHRSFAAGPSGGATVTISRLAATAPDCPEWTILMRTGQVDEYKPRFGCLNASSLAASVHRPSDLLGGRALGNADGPLMEKGVQEMRAGKFDIPVTSVTSTTAKK